jgi:hypothetical protein
VIKVIKPEDVGEYKCDAKNPFGAVTRIFSVTIPGSSDKVASVGKNIVYVATYSSLSNHESQCRSCPLLCFIFRWIRNF